MPPPQLKRIKPALKSTTPRAGAPEPVQAPDVERDSAAEMSEVLQGFRARAEREEQRYWDAVDSEYWVCLVFQTREQVEEFTRKLGLAKWEDKYLDGLDVAAAVGVRIESPTPGPPRLRIDHKLSAMARPLAAKPGPK